jgi:hypothetical protein
MVGARFLASTVAISSGLHASLRLQQGLSRKMTLAISVPFVDAATPVALSASGELSFSLFAL